MNPQPIVLDRNKAVFEPISDPWELEVADTQWSGVTSFWTPWLLEAVKPIWSLPLAEPDWDGYGSPPVQAAAVERAVLLLARLACRAADLPLPVLAPVSGGGVQLEWLVADREIEVEILPEGTIDLLVAVDDAVAFEGTFAASETEEAESFVARLLRR